MSETTWHPHSADMALGHGTPRTASALAALWNRAVTAPLHRILDAGLRAGELQELGGETLRDIGYRRD